MNDFDSVYDSLNEQQRKAVDTIEGPVLVIAGPGTGKTQLLSARVANIMKQTDTPAANILCLTFTESGAANMRERLARFIGIDAYNVTISTYHAFGDSIIQRYPEYFTETRLQNKVDDLTKRGILMAIVEAMGYDNPLKQSRHHIGDLMTSVSELKRALLTGEQLRVIATENMTFIEQASKACMRIFADFKSMPGIKKALPYFAELHSEISKLQPAEPATNFGALAELAYGELSTALNEAEEIQKTKPLTTWKNNWLVKNSENQFIFGGELENRRLLALKDVLEQYQAALATKGLYDFDDMIIRAVDALKTNDDLKFTLQEKYLYILLDEFQDTNAAQLSLIQLLSDNPINEGRPNVLAVGDDDQAIYAFQGAQYSNMLDFMQTYREVSVVNLTENYRSHADVLHTAKNVAEQIESRLDSHFTDMTKTLTAANTSLPNSVIERISYKSPISERSGVAASIRTLIDSGVKPTEIAVLAPKHKHLEPLVPYLNSLDIPVSYEKRENILEAPVVRQLISMSKLAIALHRNKQDEANALWAEVLSYDCFKIPVTTIWSIAWQVADYEDPVKTWSQAVMQRPELREPVLLFLSTATKVTSEPMETVLDYLTGMQEISTHEPDMPVVRSPLRDYCCGEKIRDSQPELFLSTVSHLAVLRARLREYQDGSDAPMSIIDFIEYVSMYQEAEQQILNTSPYNQKDESVQLMTVFKAKGLEYEHVFLLHCEDEIWGSGAKGNSNKLTLPANLAPIRHGNGGDDEKLRVLFVAITRAKYGLHLSSSEQLFSGKRSTRLKYFDERELSDKKVAALVLPEDTRNLVHDDQDAPDQSMFEMDWRNRHTNGLKDASLRSLIGNHLKNYQMSPTHLVSFIDLEYAGPQQFLLGRILNLPEAPSLEGIYGTAVHDALEWTQNQVSETGFMPNSTEIIEHFRLKITSQKMPPERIAIEWERGQKALEVWLKARSHIFGGTAVVEKSFRGESVFVEGVHMAGRIDRLEVDEKSKSIVVVDYKTGACYDTWKRELKLHKNRLQLYCYKLLIENSRTYKGYTVQKGRLEFVEPDDAGKIKFLELDFDEDETARVRALIKATSDCIQNLEFPDVSKYPATLKGVETFEANLLEGTA